MVAHSTLAKIQIRTDDLTPFFRYDKAFENYLETGKQLNFSKGTWYWINVTRVLEFHPDDSGFIFFGTDDNREYLYLEKPKRVLIFPFSMNNQKPFVSSSFKINRQDLKNYEPVFRSGEDPQNLALRLNEKVQIYIPKEYRGPNIKEWGKLPKFTLLWGIGGAYNEFTNHVGSLRENEKQFEEFVRGSNFLPDDLMPLISPELLGKFRQFFFGKMIFMMQSDIHNPIFFYQMKSQVQSVFDVYRTNYMDAAVDQIFKVDKEQDSTLEGVFNEYLTRVLMIAKDMVEDFFFGKGLPIFRAFYSKLPKKASKNPVKIAEARKKDPYFMTRSPEQFAQYIAIVNNAKENILNPEVNMIMKEIQAQVEAMIEGTFDTVADAAKNFSKSVCQVNHYKEDDNQIYKNFLLRMSFGDWVADDLIAIILPQVLSLYEQSVFVEQFFEMPLLQKIGFGTGVKKNNSSYEQFREMLMVLGYVDYQEDIDKERTGLHDFKSFLWAKDRILI